MRWLTEHNNPRNHKNFHKNSTNPFKIRGGEGSEEERKVNSRAFGDFGRWQTLQWEKSFLLQSGLQVPYVVINSTIYILN